MALLGCFTQLSKADELDDFVSGLTQEREVERYSLTDTRYEQGSRNLRSVESGEKPIRPQSVFFHAEDLFGLVNKRAATSSRPELSPYAIFPLPLVTLHNSVK